MSKRGEWGKETAKMGEKGEGRTEFWVKWMNEVGGKREYGGVKWKKMGGGWGGGEEGKIEFIKILMKKRP